MKGHFPQPGKFQKFQSLIKNKIFYSGSEGGDSHSSHNPLVTNTHQKYVNMIGYQTRDKFQGHKIVWHYQKNLFIDPQSKMPLVSIHL